MTKDEAIEKLQDKLNHGEGSHESELETAIRLGIEALKAVKQLWSSDPEARIPKSLLPGETES
jgi:hypothetical protein